MSYPEAFAENYDRWAADMTEDVESYVQLATEADGPVVELAVGTGRVAVPVARAIGRKVIGVDSSPAMLGKARDSGADLLDLRLGDLRELALEEPAALIYCPYRALLHVPRGPTAESSSSASRLPCYPVGGSRGTPSRSTTRSPRVSTDSGRRSPSRTRCGMQSGTAE